MTQPVVHVISHPTSTVVNDCVNSLKQHGWTFELFPAVDGKTVTTSTWKNINVILSTDGKMSRRPGAQGCWLSHWNLWNKCVDENQNIIVMEHDALVTGPWPTDLDVTVQLIKLYSTAECKQHPVYGLWSKGSHAYTLTPAQAKTLINHARATGAQAVDKHLGTSVLPWSFYKKDLVMLNLQRGPSTTSSQR